jgi:hypothetical protein
MNNKDSPNDPKNDQLRLTAMQVFVLAMIARAGVRTLYEFKAAGLSTGAVGGPISTLLKQCLLSKTKDGAGRQTLSITRSGVAALEAQWQDLLEEVPVDVYAAFRGFWVACLMGSPAEASLFLQRFAAFRGSDRGLGWSYVPGDEGRYLRDPSRGYKWLLAYWTDRIAMHKKGILEYIASLVDEQTAVAGMRRAGKVKKQTGRPTQTSKSKKEER